MIVGVGVDLVQTSRIKAAAEKNRRFLTRLFTPLEIRYCRSQKNPWPHFAARFAAKEAFIKACGHAVPPHEIEVGRDKKGNPYLKQKGKRLSGYLSLAHDGDYAIALVVLEKEKGVGSLFFTS